MSEKVTLIVKAANQGSLDHKIDCSLDWDIQYVKEEIMKTHPAKPTVQEQRLIYSGQLLQDSLKLRTILRHPTENNEYTIHLVYSPKYSSNLREPQNQPPLHISPPAASLIINGNVPHANVAPESNLDGIRHRLVMNNSVPSTSIPERDFDPNLPQLAFPFQASDPLQHMAAMQHIYSQYMTSYLQYMQSEQPGNVRLSPEGVSPPPISSVPPELQNQTINDRVPPPDPNAANDQDVDRDAQMRAIGGDEEEDGIARDWLDYLYFGSRLVVLLSIVYFYSTLGRFMLVACTAVFIYLYQYGWLRFWRMEEQPAQRNENEAEANVPPQPLYEERAPQTLDPPPDQEQPAETLSQEARNENGESEQRTDENDNSNASQESPVNATEQTAQNRIVEDPPLQPTFLALSWTFLTTFFTSLIPEQHEII